MSKENEEKKAVQANIKATIKDLKALSKKMGISLEELLPILTHREIVLVNQQLKAIHEHLDMIESREALKHERGTQKDLQKGT